MTACRLQDIPHGRGWPVNVAGEKIAVFNTSKGVKAVRNLCAHIGNPIDDGAVKGCIVHCPWHGWAYDLATGEHLTNFGRRPGIRTFGVRVEGDTVFVEVDNPPDSATPPDRATPPDCATPPDRATPG